MSYKKAEAEPVINGYVAKSPMPVYGGYRGYGDCGDRRDHSACRGRGDYNRNSKGVANTIRPGEYVRQVGLEGPRETGRAVGPEELGRNDACQPYSVVDVLQKVYHVDFLAVLEDYVSTEVEQIKEAGILRGAEKLKARMWEYKKTLSKLQQPVDCTVVDVILRSKLEGSYKDGTIKYENVNFRLRYYFDLRFCHQWCMGPQIQIWDERKNLWSQGSNRSQILDRVDQKLSEYPINTNDYLLPILYNRDYETVAHAMLNDYFPEVRKAIDGDASIVSSDELAKRMGLHVREVRFKDRTVMGQLYYNFCEVDLLDANGADYILCVPPGTILISKDNCTSAAIRNSTIAHECCHMYLDRWFFLLQMMSGEKYRPYSSRRKENRKYHHKNDAIDWMELQCEKLPAYLLLERDSVIEYVEGKIKQSGWKKTPENIRLIVDGLAENYKVSYQMAKYRLIELGYCEAGGIRNYVNEAVVPDHCCALPWPADTTFTISTKDAVQLATEDREFEKIIGSGRYRYVEGHFCRNTDKYIVFDRWGKPHLTAYARCHIEECCLSFTVGGRYRKTGYDIGKVARNKTEPVNYQYRATYSLVAEPGTSEYYKENDAMVADGMLWMEFYKERPMNFSEAAKLILDKKKITREKLALELGVDRRAVYKYLNQESPSVAHVVGFCVALKVPYYISMDLLDLAGIRLRATQLEFTYRQFLMNAESLSVSRCEDTLEKNGMPPLFRGQRDE